VILSVTDNPLALSTIETLLKEIDVAPPQIVIEADIIEASYSDKLDLGVEWNTAARVAGGARPFVYPFNEMGDRSVPGVFPAPTVDEFTFGTLSAEQLSMTLKFLASVGDVEVISKPRLVTVNNKEAYIFSGIKFPITKPIFIGQIGSENLQEFVNVGVELHVRPRITGDKMLSMTIHPIVSEIDYQSLSRLTPQNTALIEGRYPIIQSKEVNTEVQVASGDTIVIAGLLRNREKTVTTKVPLLGDIPIIGYFFRSDEILQEKVELLILITPYVLSGERGLPLLPSLPWSEIRRASGGEEAKEE
jgi:type II secretory pathway component GspD/PulD (secretin)